MNVQRRTSFTLPDDLADEVERLIAQGVVHDIAEILANGLSTLEDQGAGLDDAALLRALEPVVEAMDRDPTRAIPASRAWAQISADIARRHGED